MQICSKHWHQIFLAIEDRGMKHLISRDANEVSRIIESELNGDQLTPENFDPLLSANWMICTNALRCAGIFMLTPKEDGSRRCPLCELNEAKLQSIQAGAKPEEQPETPEEWIANAANGCLEFARKHKLVPEAQ